MASLELASERLTHDLFKHGVIPTELVLAFFELTTVPPIQNGELTFVRIDSTNSLDLSHMSRSRGKILSIETGVSASPSGTVPSSPVPIMDTATGTVDTGSTLILLATGTSFYWIWVLYSKVNNLKHPLFVVAFDRYRHRRVVEPTMTTKLLRISPTSSRSSSPLGTGHFEFTQIWPRALNELGAGERGHIYLVVNDIG
ncbi:hypothetical protein F5888DRAFT_1804767 [Russula emetica]|nr:hypothetical protein F5888DRAFT_1804767 [Russula emetica]